MDGQALDLNLLAVFDALLEARSVTQAAQRLGMSQPSMSYALAKLRGAFNDPLFIRINNEMWPTPCASALAPTARRILELARTDLRRFSGFEPRSTDRIFTFCMTDMGETAFLPPIIHSVFEQAPHARLRALSLVPEKLDQALEAGTVDLAIGFFPDLQKGGFYQQLLYSGGFLCIARTGNPYVKDRLTLPRFLKAPHVSVRAEGRSEEVMERYFVKNRIARRVLLTVPHFLSLLNIIPQTDLIATVPVSAAKSLSREPSIRIYPLPLKSPPLVPVRQIWHKRFHKDPANRWIREIVRTALQEASNYRLPVGGRKPGTRTAR